MKVEIHKLIKKYKNFDVRMDSIWKSRKNGVNLPNEWNGINGSNTILGSGADMPFDGNMQ